MGRNLLRVCVHIVWATWDRLPLITEDIERELYRYIHQACQENQCQVLAIGGLPDHVHLLILMPSTISISDLLKYIKGGSSHFVSRTLTPGVWFQWQGSYACHSFAYADRAKVIAYVSNQKRRHAENDLWPSLERTGDSSD